MERRATHDLHIEVPLPQGPAGRFAHGRERFGEDLVKGFPLVDPMPELVGHRAELGVCEPDEVILEEVHLLCDRLEPAQNATLTGAEDLLKYHGRNSSGGWSAGSPTQRD